MIVVDTNLIGYLFLSNEHSSHAEQILIKDPHWIAPVLWRSELRNVLALYLRKKLLSLDEAQQIMDNALQMMHQREYEVSSLGVLNLAATSGCSAYDCEFVALARELSVPLVTVDKQILRQFPDTALTIDAFLAA